jgi:hypothetical protein
MVPHERALVKRFEDKPFALLAVNDQDDPGDIREALRKDGITWRAWVDFSVNRETITREWRIPGHPAFYIVDGKGVIRYRFLGYDRKGDLERKVKRLLKELAEEQGQ